MDAEEIHGDCGGTDGSGDGVDDCGVERAGVEKQEELCAEKGGDGEASWPEEKQDAEGEGEGNAPEAEQVKGAVIGAKPALRDPAADGGAEDAVDEGDGSGELAGFCDGHADRIVEEFGNPVGDSAHGEGEHGEAEGSAEEGGIAEKA